MPPRQTDSQTKAKSTWWSITTFDEGEREWLKAGVFPEFVAEVRGGLEECPETKKIHFQGALRCNSQQRFSAIKKILPKSHIESARCPTALAQYAMKEDTAIEEKKVRTNSTPYYTQEKALLLLACQPVRPCLADLKTDFWNRVVSVLYAKPYLVGLLSKPDTMRQWVHTHEVWESMVMCAERNIPMTEEELIVLQVLPGPTPPVESGIISNVLVYNAADSQSQSQSQSPTPREEAEGDVCE